jgi:hypothetical protein
VAEADRAVVLVRPGAALAARPRLFAALAAAFPVAFRPWSPWEVDARGLIDFRCNVAGESDARPADDALATLEVLGDAATRRAPFTLGRDGAIDRRVRGITLGDSFGPPLTRALAPEAVLAQSGGEPVWTASTGPRVRHAVRSALPELGEHDVLYALLSQRPLTSIALLQFLRAITAPVGWRPAPLRATFVFDDPNLRWRSYGHINYARLAAHAADHGYHASMAMIPLDASRPHQPTVDLFRAHRERLSLVVHGNDHTRAELLAPREELAARAIAAQAIRRITRFERSAGLTVDRVMTPPHGLCSKSMARALGAVGFDALAAIHPLPWTAAPPSAPPLAGWRAAQFVGGCAVVPRIPLESSEADIAMRAFIDHPLLVYGHHQDLAGGLERLALAADRINGLGEVSWTSVGAIVNANFETRLLGSRLLVRPLARRVVLPVPTEVDSLVVEAPTDALADGPLSSYSIDGELHRFDEPLSLPPMYGGSVELTLHGSRDVDPRTVPQPAWRPWPTARRAAAELRDRAIPRTPRRLRERNSCPSRG